MPELLHGNAALSAYGFKKSAIHYLNNNDLEKKMCVMDCTHLKRD